MLNKVIDFCNGPNISLRVVQNCVKESRKRLRKSLRKSSDRASKIMKQEGAFFIDNWTIWKIIEIKEDKEILFNQKKID